MALTEHPMHSLAEFLPEGTFDQVVQFIHHYKVYLTVTRQRKSVLGDYRHAGRGANHRISINGNLNKYEFLITLLHELAHLLAFEQYHHTVEAHGKEWKRIYSGLLLRFTEQKSFPPDIEKALQKSIINPAATANGETELLLVLRKYNEQQRDGICCVTDIPEGALFRTEKGKIFQRGPVRRKRIECVEVSTGLRYTFSPITEVHILQRET